MKHVLVLIPLLGLLLSACDVQKRADKIAADEDHLWKAQEEALKKAKAVEAEVLKAAEERRKEIDEQSR